MVYNIKKGITTGTSLRPSKFVTTPWVVKAHNDSPFVFNGVVPGKVGTEGFPAVRVGGDRTVYANFLVDYKGRPIARRIHRRRTATKAVAV